MAVMDWELQEGVWHEFESLSRADRVPLNDNSARTETVENFYSRGEARDFTFFSDEPGTKAGGEDRAPRPLEYFLAGFGFCQQVIYVQNAIAAGIEIDKISVESTGYVDPRGTFDIGDFEPGFTDDVIQYTTNIESSAPPEEIEELVGISESYCPAHDALRTPMSFDRQVRLNGEPLDI